MIPVATQATEVNNLPGRRIEATIGDARWVMKSLTKLYSNQVLAAVREISTNARDSHVLSDNGHLPIKVTLPSLEHPFFEVEDFGLGLNSDEMEITFLKYGISTKRNSNDVNGMLGFGSKAALAYSDSFTVVARKDGWETQAVVMRQPDYTIAMNMIDPVPTTERNGVRIQVPSRDYDAFRQIAMDFYRFWEPGTVEVNGVEPEWAVGEKLDDNLYYSKSPGTSYVVMGNVAYRIANPDALFRNRGMNSISFVAYVPNGSVEFTPSREDLEYTDATKATLHGVIENFEKKIVAQAKSDIASATDYFDAYTKYTYWVNKLGKGPFGDLEFKGEKFLDEIAIAGYRYRPSEYRYNMFAVREWQVSNMSDTMIVTGVSGSPSSHHKSRSRQYRDQWGMRAAYILFTAEQSIKSVWVDPKRIVSWETVKEATKKPRQPRDPVNRPKRVKGTFDYYHSGTDSATGNFKAFWAVEKELPNTKNLYFISVKEDKLYSVAEFLRLTETEAVVVVLAVNRINKFKRDNPQAKDFVNTFKPKVELDGVSFLDSDTMEALSIGRNTRQWLSAFSEEEIDDPEFGRLKRLITEDSNERLKEYNRAFNIASTMGMRYSFKHHDIRQTDDSFLEKYPLLTAINPLYSSGQALKGDYAFYINAKYAGIKKGTDDSV